jgi:poly-gamma-glutamate capsule biosynthesis protein CapA/YwtB (metallophosphatase superfamily)
LYGWPVRRLTEGTVARHIPRRVRNRLERVALAGYRFRSGPAAIVVAPGDPAATLTAVGDIALHSFPPDDVAGRRAALAAVQSLLGPADLCMANLETVLTRRGDRVGQLGSFLRAAPESIEVLERGGVNVVTCANNHCTDYGAEALGDSSEWIRAAGIAVCGVGETAAERRRPVVRTVRGVRVGFLAYCDDWRPTDGPGYAPAGALPGDILSDIAALRPTVDILVVQLHWGWEWMVHPLLSHRDQARSFADAGAHLVLCHHAHVPMAVEVWDGSVIAHGLGSLLFPWSPVEPSAHPWRDRSFVLQAAVSTQGVHTVRITPVENHGKAVCESEGWARRELLGGLSALHHGLHETDRLAAFELHRTVREGCKLASRVQAYAQRCDRDRLAETLRALRVPRGRALIAGLAALPDEAGLTLAQVLDGGEGEEGGQVARAVRDGRIQAAIARLTASRHLLPGGPGRIP